MDLCFKFLQLEFLICLNCLDLKRELSMRIADQRVYILSTTFIHWLVWLTFFHLLPLTLSFHFFFDDCYCILRFLLFLSQLLSVPLSVTCWYWKLLNWTLNQKLRIIGNIWIAIWWGTADFSVNLFCVNVILCCFSESIVKL
jgi:hypothetical protein